MRKLCLMVSVLLVFVCVDSGRSACARSGSGFTVTTETDRDSSVVRRSFRLYYVCSETDIVESYLDNAELMEDIRQHLRKSPRIDSIRIYAYASPEGGYANNARLARGRAEAARDYILANASNSESLKDKIILCPVDENWDGLRKAVAETYKGFDRDYVLRIIDDKSVSTETRKWRLQQLNKGRTWMWIKRNCLKRLRYAEWECWWEEIHPVVPVPAEREAALDSLSPLADRLPVPSAGIIARRWVAPVEEVIDTLPKKIRTVAALKTNLLYDVATALNCEVEFAIGDRFSIMVEDVFPWWTWGPNGNKYAFQMWEMGVEPRWWFKKRDDRDRLAGHFAGIYAMSAKYDFQWDYKACYQGEYWSAGLTYGYVLPLCKWLNMEFSVSAGYLRGPYRHYVPSEEYEVLWRDKYKTGTFSYFGITKAKVSLVIPIWYKYTPRQKKEKE